MNEKKLSLEHVNTLINTIISIMGTLISILGIVISYKQSIFTEREAIILPVRITLIILGIILILMVGFSFIRKNYLKNKMRIATNFISFKNHEILKDEEIEKIDLSKLFSVSKGCLNRTVNKYASEKFWKSSWFGFKGDDLVGSIIVIEGHNYRGKIPVTTEEFRDKGVNVLELKHEHKKGSSWAAVINSKNGKPSLNNWGENIFSLDSASFLTFWVRNYETTVSPEADKDNPSGFPLCYIRFEDAENVSSDLVIIIVKNYWVQFQIPISKFFYNMSLYKNYNEYGSSFYSERKGIFQSNKAMQIIFGCSFEMPNQSTTIQLFDIKLV